MKIRVIDKDDWTFPRICTQCLKTSELVVQFGKDHEEHEWADVCPNCLEKAVEAIRAKIKVQKPKIETTFITTKEYLADVHAAKEEAERVGQVIVRDEGSDQNRLIISSNRASAMLLEDDPQPGRAILVKGFKTGQEATIIEKRSIVHTYVLLIDGEAETSLWDPDYVQQIYS